MKYFFVYSDHSATMSHSDRQRLRTDRAFARGPRGHTTAPTLLSDYITGWRLREAVRRVIEVSRGRISTNSSVLVLCAAEGLEGSLLCDMGFGDVTVSDISPVAVSAGVQRDQRLKGLVLNAEETQLDAGSFDLVIAQDALHHLQRPIQGFTEMLRLSRHAVAFLEPHDSLVGRLIGSEWEKNDEAVNYVFRWRKRLVGDLTASYLGTDKFENHSFSFWHHNPSFAKLVAPIGTGRLAVHVIRGLKVLLDTSLPGMGNQFCGLILRC